MLLNCIAYSLLLMSFVSFCPEGPKSVPDRNNCKTPPAQTFASKLSTPEMQMLYSEKTPPAVRQQILNKNRQTPSSSSSSNNR